eukprot:Rhum_TRINITY_DN14251_c1_g1::Rhum_TRINITY_DN14251_c1_g1_i1::g.74807::m.74807
MRRSGVAGLARLSAAAAAAAASSPPPPPPQQQQRRCLFGPTRALQAQVLEDWWDRLDNIDVAPEGGFHWFEKFHARSMIEIKKRLRSVDCVVELRDARLPFSTYNEDMEKLTVDKPRVVVFNRSELADPRANEKLVEFYNAMGVPVVLATQSGLQEHAARKVVTAILKLKIPTYIQNAPVQALVIGMPNVGKSSLVNGLRTAFADEQTPLDYLRLKKKKRIMKRKMRVGGAVGVTRKLGMVNIHTAQGTHINLIDTPGFMFPKSTNIMQGKKLALLGMLDVKGRRRETVRNSSNAVFQVLMHHGMESALMAHFRMPLPPPKNFDEFRARAVLTMDLLMRASKNNMRNHTMDSFKRAAEMGGNEFDRVGADMISAFLKGKYGRFTLDEIPSVEKDRNGNMYVKGPAYIKKLVRLEQDRRDERARLLQHLKDHQESLRKEKRDAAEVEVNASEDQDEVDWQQEEADRKANDTSSAEMDGAAAWLESVPKARASKKKERRGAEVETTAEEVEAEGVEAEGEGEEAGEVVGNRVWNIKAKTIDLQSRESALGPNKAHEDYKLGKIVDRLMTTNEPILRRSGVLSRSLADFETTRYADLRDRKEKYTKEDADKLNELFIRNKRKRGKGVSTKNIDPDEPPPRTPRLVKIRTFGRPNEANNRSMLNKITGEAKIRQPNEALQKAMEIGRSSFGKMAG